MFNQEILTAPKVNESSHGVGYDTFTSRGFIFLDMIKASIFTDYDQGWLSAIIDGEGNLSLYKSKRKNFKYKYSYVPRICVGGKCLELMERVIEIVGHGCIIQNKKSKVYNVDISANGCRKILSNINLIEKRDRRILLLEALKILERRCGRGIGGRNEIEIKRLEEIFIELKKLNSHEQK
jgi:hypothetical protein